MYIYNFNRKLDENILITNDTIIKVPRGQQILVLKIAVPLTKCIKCCEE